MFCLGLFLNLQNLHCKEIVQDKKINSTFNASILKPDGKKAVNMKHKLHVEPVHEVKTLQSDVSNLKETKSCNVKPVDCTRSTESAYFINNSNECDWTVDIDSCSTDRNVNWTDLSHRKYYLLGNSVTRHYAFALRDVLSNTKREVSRNQEKSSCRGVLGTASCVQISIRMPNNRTWKSTQ